MIQFGSQAFVLSTRPLTGHQCILSLFTEEKGLWSGAYRLPKKPLQYAPFSLAKVELRAKPHQSLAKLEQIELLKPSPGVGKSSYLGLCLLQHWANLIELGCPAHQKEPLIWRLLQHVLPFFNPHAVGLWPLNLYIHLWLLHFFGFMPRKMEIRCEGEDWILFDQAFTGILDQPNSKEMDLLQQSFQLNIEDFLKLALECGSLRWSNQLLIRFMTNVFDRPMNTEKAVMDILISKGNT